MPELRRHAEELSSRHGVSPGLAAVLVGNDPASRQYVRNKQRYSAELGFTSRLIEVPVAEATTAHLLEVIDGLNRDPAIAGILIQLPLPQDVDEFRAVRCNRPAQGCGRRFAAPVSPAFTAPNGVISFPVPRAGC